MGSLFRNRFVQFILLSGLFLQIGIWVRNFSILLYVFEKTDGDAFAISMISLAEFAPIFIFSFIGGAFADRWRPKRTMIWCDLLSAVSIVAVLLAFEFGTWRAVFFATLVSAILSQFSQPSGMKLFKIHVPGELMQMGMSLYQTMFAIFMILGPILGTFVFLSFGIDVAIGVTGVAFLLSAGALVFLPPDRKADDTERSSVGKDMAAGVRYVLRSKVLTTLGLGFLAAGLALGLIQPLGIFLITERLGLPEENLQWLMTVNGFAMIIGGVFAMAFSKRIAPQKLLMLGMVVNGLALMACGMSTILWITLVAQFFAGLVLPGLQIGINTLVLSNTEESFVGRVNGILNPLFMGSMVVTMSMAGWLKDLFSLVVMYLSSGVIFLIGVMLIMPLYKLPMPKEEPPIGAPSTDGVG